MEPRDQGGRHQGRLVFSLRDASALAREPEVAAVVEATDRFLASASGPARFREARGDPDPATDAAAYRGLADIGLAGALIPETLGGSGFAPGVAALVAERLGRSLAREPFVENGVLPSTLLLALEGNACASALLGKIAKGEAIACAAFQEGAFALPSAALPKAGIQPEGNGLRVRGRKRFVAGARASTHMLVLAAYGAERALACVPSDAAGVSRQDKLLADGTFWSDVAFDTVVPEDALIARGASCVAALERALDAANLAVSCELYGLQTRVLEMTLDYLKAREQFGQLLGAFQALQHRAVNLYTRAQIGRFLLGEAVDSTDDSVLAQYASRCKARTADSALEIAKEGLQLHGAIGFSDEYDLGLYVKRILVRSAWLGGADFHRRRCESFESGFAEAA